MENTTDKFIQDDLQADILRAVTVIKADQKVSVRHLQERLKIWYGRSVEILTYLEKQGIIGPAQGRHPRVIFFDKLNGIDLAAQNAKDEADSKASAFSRGIQEIIKSIPQPPISFALLSVAPEALAPPVADGNGSNPSTQDRHLEPLIPSADVSISEQMPDQASMPTDHRLVSEREVAQWTASPRTEQGTFNPLVAGSNPALPINLCVIAYLPGNPKFNTLAFLENLKRNPPANPLITFSDDHSFEPTVKMKKKMEDVGVMENSEGGQNIHGIANLAFYVAFTECWKRDFTHFCYLEADTRCRSKGPNKEIKWDEFLVADFLDAQDVQGVELSIGGSMFLNQPFKSDAVTTQLAKDLIAKWNPNGPTKSGLNRFTPAYDKKGTPTGVGCIGAGAIYSVAGLRSLFPEIRNPHDVTILTLAKDGSPFDFEIAFRLFRKHGADSFNYVANLKSMFSSCGDRRSSEAERISMLQSGDVVLCHQIKSAEVVA